MDVTTQAAVLNSSMAPSSGPYPAVDPTNGSIHKEDIEVRLSINLMQGAVHGGLGS